MASNVPKIHAAMVKIMAAVEPIAKSRENTQQRYNFRGVDDVYQALQAIMAREGVYSLPTVIEDRTEERLSSSNKALIYRILKIKYTFYCAEDGSSTEAVVIGEGMDSGDKASNKAMSVADKYCLLQAFKVPTDDPKDPENPGPQDDGIAPKAGKQANAQPQQGGQQKRPADGKLHSNSGVKLSFTQEGLVTMLHEAQGAAPDGVYDASKGKHKKLLGALCQLEDVTDQASMQRLSEAAMAEQAVLDHLDSFIDKAVKAGKHLPPKA